MSWGISIDPGINLGYSIWQGFKLWNGGTISVQSGLATEIQCKLILERLPIGRYSWIALEQMEYREGPSRKRGTARDLIKVTAIGAMVAGYLCGAGRLPDIRYYPPSSWMANTPDRILNHRIAQGMAASGNAEVYLKVRESITKSKRQHFVESAGIGLFHLGIIRRGAVLQRRLK